MTGLPSLPHAPRVPRPLAAPAPHPGAPPPPDAAIKFQHDFDLLWSQSTQWISDNSLRIVVGVVIGAAIVFALTGFRALGVRLCRSDKEGTHWRSVLGRVLANTRLWFMIPLAAELIIGFADAPTAVRSTVHFAWVIAVTLQAALWARELIIGLVEHRAGDHAGDHVGLRGAMGIIRLLTTLALFAIAAVLILDNLGVNVTGLVAGLGIGGIAIGLAAQGIFADLFAALSILFDRPFRHGDLIKWDDTVGTVEAIGLKTSRIRAQTGEEVVISNANLLNKELHNMARLDRRRVVLKLGLIYQTPPEVCEGIPAMLRGVVEGHEDCKLVRCGMTGFGDSSLDFELQFDVRVGERNDVFDRQSQVCIAILAAFNKAGIEFAYPTQTSFTAAPDGKLVLPYPMA